MSGNTAVHRTLSLLPLLLALAGGADAAAAARPNIVFILCDDLGYGDLGVFFQNQRRAANDRREPCHLTPRLDTLAAQGLQLRQHYSPAPVCAPSRASFLLGVHQGHANVRDNQFDKALETNHTVATVLRQAGYATGCIGKWGLQGAGANAATWSSYPTRCGFDDYFGYVRHGDGHEHYPKEGTYGGAKEVWDNGREVSADLDACYTTDLFTARAKQWIVERHADDPARPFFLFLAYDTPHAVLELPTMAYPAGGGLGGGLQWLGTPGQMINTATGAVDSYVHPDYSGATYDDDGNGDTAEVAWPAVYKRYATSVRRIDDAVGDLRKLLGDLGIADNTLIVFTSDNGPSNEDYLNFTVNYRPDFFNSFGPFDGMKRDCWEGGIRVGALACWPGNIGTNRVSNLPCSFPDWLPTFADLAGVPAPARSDGVSLAPTLTGSGTQRTPTVYVEYAYSGTTPAYAEFQAAKRGRARNQMQAIRHGDYLGVRYDIQSHADDFEIYDVVNDPRETVNLASANAALQLQLKDRVLRLRRPDGAAPRPYDAEPVPALASVATVSGVVWRACSAAFPWVPELTALPPSSTGTVARPDLGIRPRDTDIGLLFSGYLRVPATGSYTFFLTTDARALLRLHEATVLDADFAYTGGTERSASATLTAGLHPFRLYYARGTGGTPALALQWSGPGFARQAIPDTAFRRDGAAANAPPQPAADAAATPQDSAVYIDVLANDTDDDLPSALALASVGHPAAGSAVEADGRILYTPNPGFLGEDRFTYSVTDSAFSATATVTVAVYFHNGEFWYPLNQNSGLTTREAGGGWPAALVNVADEAAAWVPGRCGYGLRFDGTNDYVSLTGFLGIRGADARTCAAWIQTTGTGQMPVIAWGPNTAGDKWTFLIKDGNARLEVTQGWVQGSRLVNDGQWHHIACTFTNQPSADVTNVLLFVDGARETVLSLQDPQAIHTTSTAPVKVGSDVQNRYFSGVLDEVRIYPRALAPAEIAALAAAQPEPCAGAWQRRHFGATLAAWQDDPDGDGVVNLAEYAFGSQPLIADPRGARLRIQQAGEAVEFGYVRRAAGLHALVYTTEYAPRLPLWQSLTTPTPTLTPHTDPALESAWLRLPPAWRTSACFRVRAVQPW